MDIEDIEVFVGTGRRQDSPLGHGGVFNGLCKP